MSRSASEAVALARLATCDAELHRVRGERAAVVGGLERQRRSIASLKARPRRAPRRPPEREAEQEAEPSALADRIETDETVRYEQLVHSFEAELERQAPLLVKLAEQVRRIEERRQECLSQLSLRIQTAYTVRVAAGRLPAIACAAGDACGECGHALPGDASKEDRERAILICPSCQRLVYVTARPPRVAR
jgi:hypothetical protein